VEVYIRQGRTPRPDSRYTIVQVRDNRTNSLLLISYLDACLQAIRERNWHLVRLDHEFPPEPEEATQKVA
jgi:hypothetical protein